MERLADPVNRLSLAHVTLTIMVWCGLVCAWSFSGGPQAIDGRLVRPLLFELRSLFEAEPIPSADLHILAFDNSTFAEVGRSALTPAQWTMLLQKIGSRSPSSILVNYMFGSGEQDGEGSAELLQTLTTLRERGVKVAGASFVYSGDIPGRPGLDQRRLRTSSAFANRPALNVLGPPAPIAEQFTALGHTTYNENGTTNLGIPVGRGAIIEHLATLSVPPAIPATSAVGIDFTPRLHSKIKSMSSLLRGSPDSIPEGAHIVILSDYYTGGTTFFNTPIGQLPAGFVTAAAVDTHLREAWQTTSPFGPVSLFVAVFLGAAISLLRSPVRFLSTMGFLLVAMTSCALYVFVRHSFVIDWLSFDVALAGTALSGWLVGMQSRLRHQRLRETQLEREASRLQAVVRTAQMFAHDVRKPFRLVQMAKDTFQGDSQTQLMQSTIERLLPELETAIANVERMTKDLMEFDGQMRLHTEPTTLNTIVERSLLQMCRGKAASLDVSFSYQFDHLAQIEVDTDKLQRVVANLIGNGIEACGGSGSVWVYTKDILDGEKSWVQVTIGNSDSFIPEEDRQKVFEAFYTAGKRGGTGLGLAIVKQIVEAHGGKIWCTAEEDRGTEFCMTLPVAKTTPGFLESTQMLPQHTSDFYVPGEQKMPRSSASTLPLMAVIDDSEFTLQTWEAVVDDAEVLTFRSPTEFMEFTQDPRFQNLVMIVTDMYFDNDVKNGLDLAEAICKLTQAPILLSSDAGSEAASHAITINMGKSPQNYSSLQRHLPKAG